MAARPDRPLFLLDLAMPPDVEPEAGKIRGVTLYGLEALTGIADEHRSERQVAAKHAEGIIDREVEHFKELLVGAESEPLIRALGERAESVRSEELARALSEARFERVEFVERMQSRHEDLRGLETRLDSKLVVEATKT